MGLENYVRTIKRDRPVFYAPLWSWSTLSYRDITNRHPNGAVAGTFTFPASFMGGICVKFPGTAGNQITYADANDLDLGDVWTCEAWFKPNAAGSTIYSTIVSKAIQGASAAYGLFWDSTNDRFVARKTATTTLAHSGDGSVVDNDGIWRHIVATKNGATTRVFVNGKDVTVPDTNAVCNNLSRPLGLGSHENSVGTGNENPSASTQAHVAVYNYPLSPAQVLSHYKAAVFKRN